MPANRIAIFKHGPGAQRGAAMLIILVLLVVAIAAVLINSLTTVATKNARHEQTAAVLAQAREALIGYAVTYGDTHSGQVHGYLPCPDSGGGNPEGSAEPSCGTQDVSVIGRLPWATLNLSALRDGEGECLWYGVSGTYKNSPQTGLMNWDTNGQLQAYAPDGTLLTPPDNQVVAVIIAPGAPQSGQDRSGTTAPVCGGNYTAANYLDNDTVHSINNADIATGKFIQGSNSGSVNDQMLFITRQDIWNAVQKRSDFVSTLNLLTQRVAECLANYGRYNSAGGGGWGGGGGGWGGGGGSNDSLPWAAPLALGDYSSNTQYQDQSNLYAGRVPYSVSTSKATTGNVFGNLMTSANCPAGWASIDSWWNNWKDHLFYAIGQSFKPSSNTNQSCGTCLRINGAGQYAAVVMFAGQRLPALNQTRVNKSIVTDYLEGNNASNFTGANGQENYVAAPVSSTFNDVLYCISPTFSITPCP